MSDQLRNIRMESVKVGPTLYKCYTNVLCFLSWLYVSLVEWTGDVVSATSIIHYGYFHILEVYDCNSNDSSNRMFPQTTQIVFCHIISLISAALPYITLPALMAHSYRLGLVTRRYQVRIRGSRLSFCHRGCAPNCSKAWGVQCCLWYCAL